MENYTITDALTGDTVTFDYTTGDVELIKAAEADIPKHKSIFFPGCSFLNYAMPLVTAVYDTLVQHEAVDGMSLLCCGKILSYEPNGDVIRPAFEEDLKEHVLACGIEEIVCACPNCVKALREAFAEDNRVSGVKLTALPALMAKIGYQLDKSTVAALIKGDPDADVLLCTHDSCPDREYGEFADGLRAVMPDGLWVDPKHCRKRSVCCGSLPRAQGKNAQADKCANLNGEEALETGADAIVTACVSCDFQLNMAQSHIQPVHFLEMLYNWRINWATVGAWMKLRFLFNETLGVTVKDAGSNRSFAGLGSADPTVSDMVVAEARDEGAVKGSIDEVASSCIDISNDGVNQVGL